MELTKVWPFTDRARRVLNLAEEESRVLNRGFVGTEHLLLGLIREGEGIAAKALEALNVSPGAVRLDVERVVGQRTCTPTDSPLLSPGLQKVLQLSVRESLQLGHNYIGTEHLLLGLVVEGEGVAARVLSNLGLAPGRVCQRVIQQLSGLQYR
jgi:ATP-dependent Clp protease ATP-binding subunit ClpC